MTNISSPKNWRGKIKQQAEAFGMKGQHALDVISLTKSAIKEELQAEIKNERYQQVAQFLLDQSVRHGKNALFNKIIQKVASRLILRLGLPGGLAVSVATLIVPVVLKGLGKKVLKNPHVQNWLTHTDKGKGWPGINIITNYFKKSNNAEVA